MAPLSAPSHARHRAAPVALLLAALLCASTLLAGSASARVVSVLNGSEVVTVGLQPHESTTVLFGQTPSTSTFNNDSGAPVMTSASTYAIYWDPTDRYHGDWQGLIDTFLQDVGSSSGQLGDVFAVDTQYLDSRNHRAPFSSTFLGAYADTDAYPSAGCVDPEPMAAEDRLTCLTDSQIRTELQNFVTQHGLQRGMNTLFFLLTPPGVTVCLDQGGSSGNCSSGDEFEPGAGFKFETNFCSYHSAIAATNPSTGDGSTILYAMMPWTAGGVGDGHLQGADQTEAYDCQDGGFEESGKVIEREHAKEHSQEEQEKISEESGEEKEARERKEVLEGPHVEEPNQPSKVGPDGFDDTGLADVIVTQMASEIQDSVTDPLLNGWQDSNRLEGVDECRNDFSTYEWGGSVSANEDSGAGTLSNEKLAGHDYYLNNAFNLAGLELPYPGHKCTNVVNLAPAFTMTNPVHASETVGFDGMESDITLGANYAFPTGGGSPQLTYATFSWNFGDGTPTVTGQGPGSPTVNSPGAEPCAGPWAAPCAGSTFHTYQYGGVYEVTLTVTDVAGDVASLTQPITVVGPPPPAPPAEPAPGGSAGTTTASSAPTASPGAGGASNAPASFGAAPALTGRVESKSLKKALSGGLPVRYTVDQQVAGSAQVLLDSVTAKRLGLHGSPATGLPKGTPRSIVVGTALLVTTKAGKGTIRIKFSRTNAKRLAGVKKLRLTLRLFVRNASRQSPRTATVLSTFTLIR